MFENIEKIEKELYAPAAYFKLKNVVTFGSKNNSSGSRMDAVYAKNYRSSKYSNYETLNTLAVRTSDYLVLSYTMKDSFFEIYVSYPHMKRLVEGFKAMAEMLYVENLFIERANALYINGDYQHISVKINNLVGGKSVVMVPDVITDKHNGEIAGVLLYLGKETNAVQIEFEAFESLVYFLEKFDLLQSSQLLTNMGANYVILNGGVTSSISAQPAPAPTDRPNIRARKILNADSGSKPGLFESEDNNNAENIESDGEDLKSKAQSLFDDEPVAETDVFEETPPPTKKAPSKAKAKPKADTKAPVKAKSKGKLGAAALMAAIDQEEEIDLSNIPDIPDEDLPF